MKRVSQLCKERNLELFVAYKRELAKSKCPDKAIGMAILEGSSRFWVEPECLRKVIYRIQIGDGLLLQMKPHRRNMFFDLYVLYQKVRNDINTKNKSVSDIASVIVEYPASSFYILPSTARKIINREIKRERK